MVETFDNSIEVTQECKVDSLKRICDEIRLDEELMNLVNTLDVEEKVVFYDALKQFIRDDVQILLIYLKAQKTMNEGFEYEMERDF